MKKFKFLISIISSFLACLDLHAQWPVSTVAENKRALLEEFTGIYCTFCPDGHIRAQALKNTYGSNFWIIKYHVGNYAAPNGNDPDYRTSFGNDISVQSGLTGYPAGTINRRIFSGLSQGSGTAMGRGNWSNATTQLRAQPAYVNIGVQAQVNEQTRQLRVITQYHYTGNGAVPTNKLNIALLQNNIEGPQTGASSFYPGNIQPNGKYLHQHMLRHMITGQWGVDILNTTAGSTRIDTFFYTIPASLNGVDYNLGNLEVVAFVAEGQQNVINVNGTAVSVFNHSNVLDAGLVEISEIQDVCPGLDSISTWVKMKNNGATALTSVVFNYNVNGGPVSNHSWTGNLNYGNVAYVNIPNIGYNAVATNNYNLSLATTNGINDPIISNNNLSETFNLATETTYSNITIRVSLDGYGGENSWTLKNGAGITIASSPTYTSLNNSSTNPQADINLSLPDDCYTFQINDSYGDGMCCNYGNGSYQVLANNVLIPGMSGAQFGSREIKKFTINTSNAVIFTVSASNAGCYNNGSAAVAVTNGIAPFTYQWSNGQTGATAVNLAAGNYYVTVTSGTGATAVSSVTVGSSAVASINTNPAVITNSNCGSAIGSISVTPTNGSAPYNYQWSNGSTAQTCNNLSSGIYNVTITDVNGCTGSVSNIIVNNNNGPTVNLITNNPISCYGASNGSISANSSGGNSPFTYRWNNNATTSTISALSADLYYVTVTDALNCSSIAIITLSQPADITVTTLVTPSTSSGVSNGAINLTATGGVSPYNYLWSNGSTNEDLNGIANGTYSVTVTDVNGCTEIKSVIVSYLTSTVYTACNNVTAPAINIGFHPTAINGNTPSPVLAVQTVGLPNTEYLVIKNGTCALNRSRTACDTTFGGGDVIIGSDIDGVFNPATMNRYGITLTTGDTFSIVPFAYNLSQVRSFVNQILTGTITGAPNSCCALFQLDPLTSGYCDSLNNAGINSQTDVNNLTDVITVIEAMSRGKQLSVNSLIYYFNNFNSSSSFISNAGCGTLTDNNLLCYGVRPMQMYSYVLGSCVINYTLNTVPDNSCIGAGSASINMISSGNFSYQWSNGATGSIANNLFPGNYVVTISSNNIQCTIIPVNIGGGVSFNINVTAQNACGANGSASVIIQNPNNYQFSWSNGASSQTANNLFAGNYTVTVSNINSGCSTIGIFTVPYNQNSGAASEICLVSVDNSNGKNQIIWEKSSNQGIIYYKILKQNTINSQYDSIATVPFDSFSVFLDLNSNPSQQSNSYKITAVDSCGGEGQALAAHTTIHLTANQGVNNNVNLLWNAYSGFTYPNFEIYRSNNGSAYALIGTVANTTYSYTDLTPPTGTNYYFVSVTKPTPCNPTKAAVILRSVSNTLDGQGNPVISSTVNDIVNNNAYNIYPNPTSSFINIEKTGNLGIAEISIYDVLGRKLSSIMPEDNPLIQMEMPQIPGTYYISIEDENGKRELFKVLKI